MIPKIHTEFLDRVAPDFTVEQRLHRILYQGAHLPADDLPGTHWMMPGQALAIDHSRTQTGPVERMYMVVAVAPHFSDYDTQSHLSGGPGGLLLQSLTRAGIDREQVYYTTVTRFPMPRNSSSYRQSWLATGWEYVLHEIDRVKPRALLFLGSEAAKLAYGRKTTLEEVRGQVRPFTSNSHSCMSMAASSHLAFVTNTAGLDALVKQIEVFRSIPLQPVKNLDGLSYEGRDYQPLWTIDDIRRAVDEEIAEGSKVFAIDVETGTDTGHPEDEYCVSFQWSTKAGKARVIPLMVERPERMVPQIHTTGKLKGTPVVEQVTGCWPDEPPTEALETWEDITETGDPIWVANVPVMVPEFGGAGVSRKCAADRVAHWEQAAAEIRRLLTHRPDTVMVGHNLRYDLTALRNCLGLEIRQFCNGYRSFDTMLACHALGKEASFGLKEQTLKHTDIGAYDAPMHAWCAANSGAGKLFPGSADERFFHGFRDIPYCWLLPYACSDVGATIELYDVLRKQLDEPGNERIRQLYYEVDMPLQHPLIDIETLGMPADEQRLTEMGDVYRDKYQSLIEELRDVTGWPTLNIGSSDQLQALIYRPPFKKSANILAKVPPTARLMNLEPMFTTGKYPRKWKDVVEQRHELYSKPSCKVDHLSTMRTGYQLDDYQKKVFDLLIDVKELGQFVNLFLREPCYDTPTATGRPYYGKGLRGCINSRGRICTRVSLLSETKRWRHSDPNLANLPKTKEKNIERIMGHKVPPVRSGFCAPPGWKILECDYKSAELYVVGYMSGDPAFIEVLESGMDVHGYNAVKVFGLDCHPNEVEHKYKDKRAAVKTVVFGIIYGLSAAGLADKLTVTLGRLVTVEEAKQIIEQFYNTYPGIRAFVEESKRMCLEVGYVETAYGSRRYFPGVSGMSRDKQAAAMREATNARIQGTVAVMLDIASVNLDRMRYEQPIGQIMAWEYIVAIHDAMFTLVRDEHVEVMAKVISYCMAETVPIPGTGGKTLKVSAEAGRRWQEGFEKVNFSGVAA